MVTPSKTLAPNGALVDLQTGRATPPFNNYLNNLTQNVNASAAGSVTTAPGSGLFGGGFVADGISIGIAANGVTNAMIRQSAAYSVIGRGFGTAGDVADITATADNRVLARIGGVLAFWDATLVPGAVADANYGDITVSAAGTVWAINANVVSNAKFRQSTALTVVGRSSATTGNVADIAGSASQFFGINAAGTTLGFQTLVGDATLSGPTITFATVNPNVGMFGSITKSAIVTVNAKGLITGASESTITPAVGSITGFGTNVATFLATPSSANLASATTDETGTGALVFAGSPTFTGTVTVAALTATGAVSVSDFRQSGGSLARFENTAASAPTGSTGLGVELIGASGGKAVVQSVNRTTVAFGELNLSALAINFQLSGTDTLILESHFGNFANDAAAAVGGVPVKGLYRNGSVLMVRVV